MVAPLILGALGLAAKVAPDIVGLFAGDDSKVAKAAKVASGVAKTLTGEPDDQAAVKALQANPELLVEFERELRRFALKEQELENERLRIVNETMQKEAASGDAYVRRWRPTFGYIVSFTWAIQFMAVAYTMVANPQFAKEIVEAIVALSVMWGIALAVLGVNVVQRSRDKQVAAGVLPSGLGAQLKSLIGGRKGAA